MNKFEALIITGKLEVYVTDEKELFDEVKSIQKFLVTDDLVNLAISLGKLDELSKSINEKVGKYLEDLINYCVASNAEMEDKLHIAIEDLHMSVRSFNCLMRNGYNTVGDILKLDGNKLIRVRNLGIKSLDEVIEKMKELGFNDWASKIGEQIKEITEN